MLTESFRSYFSATATALARKAEAITAAYRKFPKFSWEPERYERSLLDALKFSRWAACKQLEELADHLRPSADDEITIACFIAPLAHDAGAYRLIEKDILRAIHVKVWASLIEPHSSGLTHSNLLLRINRNQLHRLEKIVHELNAEAGFSVCKLSRPSDSQNWSRPDKLPGLVGYCGKNALNIDRILSFRVWLGSRRWIRSSSKAKRPLAPYGFIPPLQNRKNPLKSIPPKNTPSRKEDERLELQGRLLNDKIAAQPRLLSMVETPFATSELGFSAASVMLNQKLSESQKEASLELLRALSNAELLERAEAQKTQEDKIKQGIKRRWKMRSDTLLNIQKLSQSNSISAIADELNNAVNNGDISTVKKYGLSKNADMRCDTWRVLDIGFELKKLLSDWNGTNLKKQKEIDKLLKELRVHEHTLKFAKIYIAIENYFEKRGLYGNSEIYTKLRKQLRFHKKLTAAAYWTGIDLMECRDERILQRLLGTDLRLNKTRAEHGREEKRGQKFPSKISGETSSRVRTRDERNLEIACAFHEDLARAERQQHARKFLSTSSP